MVLQRYLAQSELVLKDRNPIFFVEYKGILDTPALREAYGALCTRHPVLAATVTRNDNGYLLFVNDDHSPEIIFKQINGGEAELVEEAAHAPNPEFGLSRLIVAVNGRDCGRVAIQVNHMFFDGHGIQTMLRELWQIYTDLIDGRQDMNSSKGSLPPQPSELMSSTLSSVEVSGEDVYTRYANHIVKRIRLTTEETTLLRGAARAHRTSVHAAVCGALLVSLRHNAPSDNDSMLCYSLLSLRERIIPPVDAKAYMGPSIYHRADVTVRKDSDPILVGDLVRKQIDVDAARQLSAYGIPGFVPWTGVPYFTPWSGVITGNRHNLISVNNAGVVSDFPHPNGLDLVDLVLLPEIEFDKNMIKPAWPFFLVSTYRGQLSIKGVFPPDRFNEGEVDEVVDRYRLSLRKAG